MLILSKADILEAISPTEVMAAVERAMDLYETKDFSMPSRMQVQQEDSTLLLMPCFTREGFGTKLVTVFPGNVAKGAPVTTGVMVLNDLETGEPLALMNGQVLTAVRTGAVGGVSIRHLARPEAKRLGIVGTGGQGLYQAIFGAAAGAIEAIYVFNRTPAKVKGFLEELSQKLPNIKLIPTTNVEELLAAVDIVVTATTSFQPVLPDKPELLRGKHFVGIGSFQPEMREYPKAIYPLLKRVFIDTQHAGVETGDLAIPLKEGWLQEEQVETLGYWVNSAVKEDLGETTFFKSVGMALFDLLVAQLIYSRALQLGLGQRIQL